MQDLIYVLRDPGATKDPGATIDLTKNLAQWYWISVSHRVYI